jgi:HEAT repeat protein
MGHRPASAPSVDGPSGSSSAEPPSPSRGRSEAARRDAVVAAVRGRCSDPSLETRQGIAAVLGELGGPAARAALRPLLVDPSDRVRRAAVLALGRGWSATVRELTVVRRYLGDPAPRVRAAAAVVLGRRGDRRSVPALLARLDGPGTWEKPSVAVALGRIGDRRAVPRLIALAEAPQSWLRVCALHALGEIGDHRGRPSARGHLEDPAWSVRGAAAVALGTLGSRADGARLTRMLDDPHPWPRRGAACALGHLHDRHAVVRLSAALDDRAPEVRVAACWALGEIGDPASRGAIARLLDAAPLPHEPEPAAEADDRLPGLGADGLLFETAVAALARLGAGPSGSEAARSVDRAGARLTSELLARRHRSPWPVRSTGRDPPTLGQLLERAAGRRGRRVGGP